MRDKPIWLLEKPPSFVDNDEQILFKSAKPPTNSEVYLHFRGYHNYLQLKSSRTSTVREASLKVYNDIERWWERTGIKIMSKNKIIQKIETMHKTWRYLVKYKDNDQKLIESKEKFVKDSGLTFSAVSVTQLNELEKSQDKRNVEDAEFVKKNNDN